MPNICSSSFPKVKICSLSLLYIIANRISFGLGVLISQHKQVEDVSFSFFGTFSGIL